MHEIGFKEFAHSSLQTEVGKRISVAKVLGHHRNGAGAVIHDGFTMSCLRAEVNTKVLPQRKLTYESS